MLDVAIAPLLWRLDHYGIDLPKTAAPLMKYAERIFSAAGVYRGADAVGKGDAPLMSPTLPSVRCPPGRVSALGGSAALTTANG